MKINRDVKRYINYIKKNGGKKRKVSENEIMKNFTIISVNRLCEMDTSILYYTGNDLKLFIDNLINIFKMTIYNYKQMNSELTIIELSTIAELSVSIDILNKITDYNKTFNEIINELKEEILNCDDNNDEENIESSDEDIIEHIFYNNDDENAEKDILKYYNKLSNDERQNQINNIKNINNFNKDTKPLVFKIMDLPVNLSSKKFILKCYLQLISNNYNSSGENKLKLWFDSLMSIPFGKYTKSNVKDNPKDFFKKLEKTMNNAIYGHEEAKRQIIQIMGQQIRNPNSTGNIIGLWGPMGCGKCFGLNTPILMYNGEIKFVQDIKVGDIIMGDDSTPRNVLSLGQGYDTMYKIILDNGDNYIVNSEHILCLKATNKTIDLKVNDYVNLPIHVISNFIIVENNTDNIVLESKNNIIEITVKEYLNLPEEIKLICKSYKTEVMFKSEECLIDPHIYGTTLNDEHIQLKYKINDRNNRLKLLAGIIDLNGKLNNNTYEILIKSEILFKDIIFLCKSLGFNVLTKDNIIIINGKGLNEIPLLSIPKIDNAEEHNLEYNMSIETLDNDKYYGFTLDDNNRFILGDFTVTHNTSLIKDGISKALDKPFIFISLGGATDASFLEGHSYTYEGSIYGRIVNGLIEAQCMDPVIYFDELDKISKTYKGEEITNILIHLTDPVQNSHFRDKYFHGIDIDLSKATLIFSYNNPSNINPILLDRITSIQTKYLLLSQKIHIAKNYLMPNILKDIGLSNNDIYLSNEIIEYIINKFTCEGGVRKIKSLLYNIVRELNLKDLLKEIKFPYNITKNDINILLKNKSEITLEKIHNKDSIGLINGLYAMSDGSYGGIIPIQVFWIPSSKPLEIKATGNLQQVIKESTEVACTVAFNYLSKNKQYKLLDKFREYSKGLHIHCPSGGTPKDGPSAGTAITIAIYSILTNNKIKNDIAITGEITLEGKVTEIGGLDNKLEGAKRAGVKLVLFPKDNLKDFIKIKENNPLLIDKNFNAKYIETINDAIKYSLL
jgi:ATP-dependent Lon protease